MAESSHNNVHEKDQVEPKGCGLFDFLQAKKEEKPEKDVVMTETESKGKNENEDKHTLMEELHRTHSHSSSSSEEEIEEGGERKKKKKQKGLKEMIKETISGDKEEIVAKPYAAIPAEKYHESRHGQEAYAAIPAEKCHESGHGQEAYAAIPAEKCHETAGCCEAATTMHVDEKKGFLDKVKDKLPGQHKKTEEGVIPTAHAEYPADGYGEVKEKKGVLEKIKDKLPGSHGHKNGEEEMKHKEN